MVLNLKGVFFNISFIRSSFVENKRINSWSFIQYESQFRKLYIPLFVLGHHGHKARAHKEDWSLGYPGPRQWTEQLSKQEKQSVNVFQLWIHKNYLYIPYLWLSARRRKVMFQTMQYFEQNYSKSAHSFRSSAWLEIQMEGLFITEFEHCTYFIHHPGRQSNKRQVVNYENFS